MNAHPGYFIAAVILLIVSTDDAFTQARCPEGRTASGDCVNPTVAQVARQSSIIASQPKISYTAPLNLPGQDSFFQTIRQRYEYIRLFGFPPAIPGSSTPQNPVTMP